MNPIKTCPKDRKKQSLKKRNTHKWPINILKMLKRTQFEKKGKERKSKAHYDIFKLSDQKCKDSVGKSCE